jgi:hypothetical protein
MEPSDPALRKPGLRSRFVLSLAFLVTACGGGSPTSPSQSVAGRWHGVSATQTAGDVVGGFSREDIVLNANGSAEIREYEGPGRSDIGTWSLSGDTISIDFATFCDRRGTVAGNAMTLTCTLDTRAWSLLYAKQ